MEEAKSRPGFPGDRSQAAAEKLRALRERANQALDDHRRRLTQIESELSQRIHQLTSEFDSTVAAGDNSGSPARDEELTALRRQLEDGRVKHDKFVEQLAVARRELDAIQTQPCASCQDAAQQLADAQSELRRLREELDAAKKRHLEDEARHEKLGEQIAVARQAISDLQCEFSDQAAQLNVDLDAANRAKAAVEKQLADLRGELESTRQNCKSFESHVATLDEKLSAASDDRLALESRTSNLELQFANAEERVRELEAENQSIATELADARSSADGGRRHLEDQLANAQQEALEAGNRAAVANQEALDADARATAAEQLLNEAAQQVAAKEGEELALLHTELEQARADVEFGRSQVETSRQELVSLSTALETARQQLSALEAKPDRQSELDELQQEFELALAELQKLKRENGALREELSQRPEASDQQSPELVAVRAERDALALQLAELQNAPLPVIEAPEGNQELDDLHRRFEMAVDDVRQLKQENAQLRDKLTTASKRGGPVAATGGGGNDWAAQRARLMAMLEEEDGGAAAEPARKQERATIEDAIAATDRVVAEKEKELAELRAARDAAVQAARAAAPANPHDALLDADEAIAAERQRLAALQQQCEEKMRAAELEFSVERAKLAREQAALRDQLSTLRTVPAGAPADGLDGKPRRRWRSALGLGEEGDESAKK